MSEQKPMPKVQFAGHEYVLKSAYDAVCKERDELAVKLHEASMNLPLTNTGWPHEKKLHEQLAAEKERADRLADSKSHLSEQVLALTVERDQARAEVERLKADVETFDVIGRDEAYAEVERLRAERKQHQKTEDNLQEAWRELDQARAEVERLNAVLGRAIETFRDFIWVVEEVPGDALNAIYIDCKAILVEIEETEGQGE